MEWLLLVDGSGFRTYRCNHVAHQIKLDFFVTLFQLLYYSIYISFSGGGRTSEKKKGDNIEVPGFHNRKFRCRENRWEERRGRDKNGGHALQLEGFPSWSACPTRLPQLIPQ